MKLNVYDISSIAAQEGMTEDCVMISGSVLKELCYGNAVIENPQTQALILTGLVRKVRREVRCGRLEVGKTGRLDNMGMVLERHAAGVYTVGKSLIVVMKDGESIEKRDAQAQEGAQEAPRTNAGEAAASDKPKAGDDRSKALADAILKLYEASFALYLARDGKDGIESELSLLTAKIALFLGMGTDNSRRIIAESLERSGQAIRGMVPQAKTC